MTVDNAPPNKADSGSQKFPAGIILLVLLLSVIWVYGLDDSRRSNDRAIEPSVGLVVNPGVKDAENQKENILDDSAKQDQSIEQSQTAVQDPLELSAISNAAKNDARTNKNVDPAENQAIKPSTGEQDLSASRTNEEKAAMRHLFQNGHTIVLICLAVLLITSLVVRQRFPWLQRRVGIHFRRWSSPIVMVSGFFVFFFGSLGFIQKEGDSIDSFPAALYETFQIFAFNISHEELDKGLLWFAMIFAMILASTVAARGISFLFHDSSVRLLLLDAKGHVIICGLGRIGRQLIEDLLANEDRRRIVVLESDEDNQNLKWARENGVITIAGDATKRENLDDISVTRASEIFMVTGSDECNIEGAVEIRKILNEQGRRSFWRKHHLPPLKCFVHVLDRDLALILREHTDSLEKLSDNGQDGVQGLQNSSWDVEVFNALERTARRLLEDIGTSHFNSSTMRPCAESEVAHIVILGFGEFGQTLALQLAELAHFENCKRLRLTLCDRDIHKTAEIFTARYVRFGPAVGAIPDWSFDDEADSWNSQKYRPLKAGQLANLPDGSPSDGIEYVCNAQYVEYIEATDDAFVEQLVRAFERPGVKPAILVCFEDDRNNFALAERLKAKLETLGNAWPIFVWIPRQRELSQLLVEKRNLQISSRNKQPGNTETIGCDVIPFGQCYGSVSYNEVTNGWTDWLARHIELVWQEQDISPSVAQLHAALGDQRRSQRFPELDWKSLDEISQSIWMKKEEWARASNRSAAIHAVLKVAALGRKVEEIAPMGERIAVQLSVPSSLDETLRKMEHYRWVAERLIAGWSYSTTNDRIRKKRWQITPWDNLDHPPAATRGSNGQEKKKDERIVQFLLGLIESGILRTSAIEPANRVDRSQGAVIAVDPPAVESTKE